LSVVVGGIVSINIALSDRVLALAENGHQSNNVVEGAQQKGNHKQLAVSDINRNVNVEPAQLSHKKFLSAQLQAATELQGLYSSIDVLQIRWLDGRSQHFSRVSEHVRASLVQQLNPEDDFVK
jgi:hypothetical protein